MLAELIKSLSNYVFNDIKISEMPMAFSCKSSSSFNKRIKKLVSNRTQFCSIKQVLPSH